MSLEVITVARLIELDRSGSLPAAPLLVSVATAQGSSGAHLAHMTTSLPASAAMAGNTFRPDAPVYPLAKTSRNPFGDMVTVGRAANNDIILTDTGVSKFHAYFRPMKGELRVHDTGSTNGTKLDGRVVTKEGASVSTLARVEFGPTCSLIYVAQQDAAEWLKSVAGALGTLSPAKPIRVPTPAAGAETMRVGKLVGAGLAVTRKEPVGSLGSEPLDALLRRLELEKFTGAVEVEAAGLRLELTFSVAGMLTSFTANGKPGKRGDLVQGLGTRAGVFRLRTEIPAANPAGGVGSPLGRITDVLASL